MSHTISVKQAGRQLEELVASLGPHDQIVLTENDRPVATIIPSRAGRRRQPGNCKGMLVINQEDDDHLGDFED